MNKLSKIGLAVTLGLSALGAQAGSITYNDTSTPAVTGIGLTLANWGPLSVLIPQFNLGYTLTGVTLNFSGYAEVSYTATNNGGTDATILDPGSVNVREKFTGTGINAVGLSILPGASITNGFDVTIHPTDTLNFNGSGSDSHVNYNPIGVNGATLADFIGGGTLSYTVNSLFIQSTSITGGSLTQNGSGSASADMTVTYTYQDTPTVPEPTSLSLLGIGLVGWAASRRKSKSA